MVITTDRALEWADELAGFTPDMNSLVIVSLAKEVRRLNNLLLNVREEIKKVKRVADRCLEEM